MMTVYVFDYSNNFKLDCALFEAAVCYA